MTINYLAVFVATLVFYIFGAIYYTVLSKQYIKAQETTEEELGKNPKWGGKAAPYAISFAFILLVNLVFANLLNMFSGEISGVKGLQAGFLLWFGFCMPVTVINSGYENRTKTLAFISTFYFLVGLLLSGFILGSWR